MTNAITVDVEEYFHPSEVQKTVSMEDWDRLPSRVYESTNRILDLFAEHNVKGTFFILGWVAVRQAALVRRIVSLGHEIGNHSFTHQLVYSLTPDEFRSDTRKAQQAIGDACGVAPLVYRAPSYSITQRSLWAFDVLAECGITHDSSVYPISHDRYGIPGFERFCTRVPTASGPILEIPIATARLPGQRALAPVGGGAYLRLLPYRYTAAGIRRINIDDYEPACIYFHPWEIDPEQPKLAGGLLSRMRTYYGQSGMATKIERLLSEFSFNSIRSIYPAPDPFVVPTAAKAVFA